MWLLLKQNAEDAAVYRVPACVLFSSTQAFFALLDAIAYRAMFGKEVRTIGALDQNFKSFFSSFGFAGLSKIESGTRTLYSSDS